ncbi:MAG: efflux transporter SaoE [Eubacteriales bacterium]|nr:efflux transporter SaoE [Eubacteriales bacterium]
MGAFIVFIEKILLSAWNMICSSSVWMVFSFLLAGVLHEFLKPEKIQKTAIGSKRIAGVFWTTVSGMLIPICSCGTIPLGISMYYSGAYLGPTLTFMTSTPMINPIALLLAFGLLGKEIAIIYLITGFCAPMIVGIVTNHFAGDELHIGVNPKTKNHMHTFAGGADSPVQSDAEGDGGGRIQLEFEEPSIPEKILSGLHWSLTELSVTISKYTVSGMLVAAFIFNVVPQSFIQNYLGQPGFISLFGITVVAALMYVCAVGHIPFIAAIVASGAAPGVAITFLMAGAATNIPELLTIDRTIGRRAMLLYFVLVVTISNVVGYITNRLLMPGFQPVLDYDQTHHTISNANRMIIDFPDWLQALCSIVLLCYAAYALYKILKGAHAGKAV